MNPYKIVEEDSSHITYQYLPGYAWFTYAIILAFIVCVFYPSNFQLALGGICLSIYYLVTMVPGRAIESKIRTAKRNNSIQKRGNRYSFSNPLTYKIPRQA